MHDLEKDLAELNKKGLIIVECETYDKAKLFILKQVNESSLDIIYAIISQFIHGYNGAEIRILNKKVIVVQTLDDKYLIFADYYKELFDKIK